MKMMTAFLKIRWILFFLIVAAALILIPNRIAAGGKKLSFTKTWIGDYDRSIKAADINIDPYFLKVAEAAFERSKSSVRYDGKYLKIAYPGGDVPAEIGVCSDEVVRTYRNLGVDLQKEVHEDMLRAFSKYPKIWGLKSPDSNIDHRRVPNLMTFFSRHGESLSIEPNPAIYLPGEIVAWELPNGLPHIGILVSQRSDDDERHLIMHNIGAGPQIEDALFVGKIIGHYRYKKPFSG